MHEASVAQSVLTTIVRECQERRARPTRALISCGQLNALNNEAFVLAFAALSEGTLCEGMVIEVEHKPFRAHCRTCDREFEIGIRTQECVHCGQDDFELLPDAPILLETIEFEGI